MPVSTVSEALPISPLPSGGPPSVQPVKPLWSRYLSSTRILFSRCLLVVLAGMLLFTASSWSSAHPLGSALLLTAGLLLTGVAAAGRLWCSLYIAGFKDRRLVADGPYSVCRHPLYFFSLLGAVGAAAASGTITLPLVITGLFLLGYQPVMAAEEAKLEKLFGAEHQVYQKKVPRLLPDWRLLAHAPAWNSNPTVFFRHATAVIWFPAAAGVVALLPFLQAWLNLPVLVKIP
ncbi:MAG: nickel-cobalt-cadmium resistance protein [Verrucomicrobiales bacterium]|nr:nickel-cobalt-cadmium resistance protein [Verrucomicrobiales bacterium]